MTTTALADARSLLAGLLALAAVTLGTTAVAADSPPASDFLEYLGSWEEGDEDWLAVAEWRGESADDGDSSEPEDKVKDDESES